MVPSGARALTTSRSQSKNKVEDYKAISAHRQMNYLKYFSLPLFLLSK